jgi:hypothetical protein
MVVSGQLHASAALQPGKDLSVSIGYEVGCAPETVWTRWRGEKKIPAPVGNLNPRRPARSLVTKLTELPQILIKISND